MSQIRVRPAWRSGEPLCFTARLWLAQEGLDPGSVGAHEVASRIPHQDRRTMDVAGGRLDVAVLNRVGAFWAWTSLRQRPLLMTLALPMASNACCAGDPCLSFGLGHPASVTPASASSAT